MMALTNGRILRIDEFIVTLDHVVLLGGSPAAAS